MEKTIHLDKEKFDLVDSGKKKFEVRLGNKDIQEGDELIIIQRDKSGKATDRKIKRKVAHIEIIKNLQYWTQEDINKFGLKIIQIE